MSTMNVLDLPYRETALWLWLREWGTAGVSEMIAVTGLTDKQLRYSLSKLCDAGLLEAEKQGRCILYRTKSQPTTEQPQRTRSRSRRRKPRNAPQAPTQAPIEAIEAIEAAATPPQVPMPPPPPTIEEVPTSPAPTLEEPVVEEKCPEGVSPFRFYAQKYGLDLDDVQRRQQTKVTERVEVVLPKSHDGRPPLSVIKGGGA